MRKTKTGAPPRRSNLYQFIRLVLGGKIRDYQIARLWKMDVKNFHGFKTAQYPVPRVDRLVTLAQILKIDDRLVYEVAKGAPAQRVYYLLQKARLAGTGELTARKLLQAYKILTESERRYKKLFANASDAIFLADTRTGLLIDCNRQAEQLLGRPRAAIIGMHFIKLHPPAKYAYYRTFFQGHVRKRLVTEMKPSEVIRKDGKIIPVLISARVFKLDGRPVIQGIFRDARGLKLAR